MGKPEITLGMGVLDVDKQRNLEAYNDKKRKCPCAEQKFVHKGKKGK